MTINLRKFCTNSIWAVAISTSVSLADGQQSWRLTTGPEGGIVSAMSSDGPTVYAGVRGVGIYKSVNAGQSWSFVGNVQPYVNAYNAIVQDGGRVFVATQGGGIFRSDNNGMSWQDITFNLPSPRIMAVAVAGDRVLVTDDGFAPEIFALDGDGNEWSTINTPGPFLFISEANGTLFGGGGFSSLYRSIDGGDTWELSDTGLPGFSNPNRVVAIDSSLFVSVGNLVSARSVYRSDDAGETWIDMSAGLPDQVLVDIVAIDDRITVATQDAEVYQSSDLGESWQQIGSAVQESQTDLVLGSDGHRALVGSWSNIFAVDENEQWAPSGNGLIGTSISCMASAGSTLFAVSSGTPQIFSSDNGGRTWVSAEGDMPGFLNIKSALAVSEIEVLLGTTYSGVYRTTDGGQTWQQNSAGIPVFNGTAGLQFEPINAIAKRNNEIFIATGGAFHIGEHGSGGSPFPSGKGVLKSTDGGTTWSPARQGLPIAGTTIFGEVFFRPINSLISHAGVLYAGVTASGVYRSANGGVSWTRIPGLISTVDRIAVSGDHVVALVNNVDGNNIFVSSTASPSFTLASGGPADRYLSAVVTDGDRLVLAANPNLDPQPRDPTLYESFDEGLTWQPATFDIGTPLVSTFAVTSQGLFAGTTSRGVWAQPAGLAGDVNEDDTLDATDVQDFQTCFTGPGGVVTQDCFSADTDGDNDVDFADFANVQLSIGQAVMP